MVILALQLFSTWFALVALASKLLKKNKVHPSNGVGAKAEGGAQDLGEKDVHGREGQVGRGGKEGSCDV